MQHHRLAGGLLAILALLVAPAAAFYAGSDVVTLTEANFQSKIKSGGVWLVEVSRADARKTQQQKQSDLERETSWGVACAICNG
jgi:hypothetical protein